MKKYIALIRILFFLTTFFYLQLLFGQNMSINNTGNAPDASSMLDISSTNKGLLIPRVTLTQTTSTSPVTSPANSLLVYNTATVNDVTPGYYYWLSAQAKWVRVGKTYTASNGLYITSGDDIRLGTNPLIENTTITQGNFNMTWNLSGTGNFDIQDAGTSKFYVKNNGLVGVNTNNPTYQFTIGGGGGIFGVDNTATFLAKNSTGSYENYFWPRWSDNIMYMNYGTGGFNIRNNSSTSTMFMTNGNYVGIGTTSPSQKLDVAGNVQFSNALMPAGQAGTTGQILTSQGTNTAPIWTTLFKPTSILTYESTGDVCITTTNPTWTTIIGPVNMSLTTGQKVFVWAQGGAMIDNNCDGSTDANVSIYNVRVSVNGSDLPNGAWIRSGVDNYYGYLPFNGWSIAGEYDVPSNGTYAFAAQGSKQAGANVMMGGNNTSSLQATMIFLIMTP